MAKQAPVAISGLWLRSHGRGDVEVLIERDGTWYSVLKEFKGGPISHVVEPLGMLSAEADSVTASKRDNSQTYEM